MYEYSYQPSAFLFFVLHWLVAAFALFVTSKIIPGMKLRNFPAALVTTVVIGLADIFVRPILAFLAWPITFLTLGLFRWVIDAIILRLVAYLLRDFEITSWWSAIFGALVLAFVSFWFHFLLV